MEKQDRYEDIIQRLKDAGFEIQKATERLEKHLAESEQPDLIETVPVEEPEKRYTFTEVRALAAGKAREGYTSTVKMLLSKHGATKLSEVKECNYASLVSDVEEYCRKIERSEIEAAVKALEAGPSNGELGKLLDHQQEGLSDINGLNESNYASFLWEARRLLNAR